MSPPGREGGGPQVKDRPDATAVELQQRDPKTLVRQSPRATRVRAVVRCDLADLVDRTGMLDDREARIRLCQLGDDTEPGMAVVIDLGSASYSMPWIFHDAAEYFGDVGVVQVQGTRAEFVRLVAAQLDEALR